MTTFVLSDGAPAPECPHCGDPLDDDHPKGQCVPCHEMAPTRAEAEAAPTYTDDVVAVMRDTITAHRETIRLRDASLDAALDLLKQWRRNYAKQSNLSRATRDLLVKHGRDA